MTKESKNLYNKNLKRNEPKYKLWRYAGIMLTYKCNAQCRFCYYNCNPDANGLIDIDLAVNAWKSLEELAGEKAGIHITGGEPFLYFNHLVKLLTESKKQNLKSPESIETNGGWAVDEEIVTEKLRILDEIGINRLKISWDPFHSEYINIESVKLLAETARKLLGNDRILVRWEKYLQEPVNINGYSALHRDKIYKSAMNDYPCRFTGRAARHLGDIMADKPLEFIKRQNCKKDFLAAKGVHIDPYGNVFNGLCSGIIIGNINNKSLKSLWEGMNPEELDIIGILFKYGPVGLVPEAEKMGFKTRRFYADKCHLCTDLRQFFFDIGQFKRIIGPGDCYFLK